MQPDIDSRESFPLLSSNPADQGGIKQAPMLDSAWLNKKTTEQLRTRPSPSVNHQRGNHKTGSYKGATGSPVVGDDGGKSSPAVRSAEEFRRSDSAKFWGSLSPSQRKPNHPKAESAHEERKEDVPDAVSHRKKRRNKWTRLDLP
jgi:hypothetical protein